MYDAFVQVIGVFAFLILLISFWQKDRKKILFLQAVMSILYALHYFLLGAYSGSIVNIIGIFRAYTFSKKNNNKLYSSNLVLYLFLVLFLVSGVITYDNIFSILPIIAALLYTLAIWNDKSSTIRIGSLFVSCIWIIYNIIVGSHVGYITESILLISTALSVLKLDVKRKRSSL